MSTGAAIVLTQPPVQASPTTIPNTSGTITIQNRAIDVILILCVFVVLLATLFDVTDMLSRGANYLILIVCFWIATSLIVGFDSKYMLPVMLGVMATLYASFAITNTLPPDSPIQKANATIAAVGAGLLLVMLGTQKVEKNNENQRIRIIALVFMFAVGTVMAFMRAYIAGASA